MTQPSNKEIRRQLGGMPTGQNDLAEYEFRIQHKEPTETGLSESDYDPDAWVAMDGVVAEWVIRSQATIPGQHQVAASSVLE